LVYFWQMGIVRTVEWKLTTPPAEAEQSLRDALVKLDMTPEGESGRIRAQSGRSLLKNRWAAGIDMEVEPQGSGSLAVVRVDMAGNKHYALPDEIVENVGDDLYDDRGITDAVQRLGKMGRTFGRKEVRHLQHLLHGSERVIVLGQGQYEKKQGLLVLTNERLFFFEKSLGGQESVEEFSLKSISSIKTEKKMTGERLVIHASGNDAEIKGMTHGQADEIARQFRRLRAEHESPAPPAPAPPGDDPIAQLEKLASLRDQGIISSDEFEQKKAELMGRI
jgi:Bacterial PH domain/Short C-terminal domain